MVYKYKDVICENINIKGNIDRNKVLYTIKAKLVLSKIKNFKMLIVISKLSSKKKLANMQKRKWEGNKKEDKRNKNVWYTEDKYQNNICNFFIITNYFQCNALNFPIKK